MSAFDAYVRLEGTLAGRISTDEPMARHTSYRIGGTAALFVECAGVADLALTLSVLDEEGIAWAVLGRGSNVLVSDAGYDGAVIVLSGEFARLDIAQPDGLVSVGAGYSLARLVQEASSRGLSGLEFAIGIPGCVGGAVRMNAGTPKDWIGGAIDTVTSYSLADGLKIRHADEVTWAYRKSSLPADEVVVECCLRLTPDDKTNIRARMEERLAWRRGHQPLGVPSCGSVFRNPQSASAGELIEACGLKGARCGDAQISEVHANFIVNTGSATADDVLALIHLARDTVEEKHGIHLKPELRFLGFSE